MHVDSRSYQGCPSAASASASAAAGGMFASISASWPCSHLRRNNLDSIPITALKKDANVVAGLVAVKSLSSVDQLERQSQSESMKALNKRRLQQERALVI